MDDRDILSNVPIFASLDERSRIEVARLCTRCDYKAGEILFRQGDFARSMYLILDGEVVMSIPTRAGQEVVLATMRRGDFFGELAMLDGSSRSATANIMRPTKLLRLQWEDFVELLGRQPKLVLAMLASFATRLRKTSELFARHAARNLNEEMDRHYSFADRVADHVAEFGGSWWFIAFFFLVIAVWMVLNGVQVFLHLSIPFRTSS